MSQRLANSHRVIFAISATAQMLFGCARVPELDEAQRPPQLQELVQRVECDLYQAVNDRLSQPYGYEWLHSWTAQANINYIVNDQSQLSPGAVITQPLNMISIPNKVSNFSQSWSLGLGAQASNTATRNDTIAFTVSLDELKHRFDPPNNRDCTFPNYTGLRSELGLKEWLASSLSPADASELNIGFHKTPKVGAGAVSVKASIDSFLNGQPTSSADCTSVTTHAGKKTKLRSAANEALGVVICDMFIVGNSDKFKFDQLDGTQIRTIAKIIKDIQDAIRLRIQDRGEDKLTRSMEEQAILLAAFVDPPIDTIAHQTQFIVVYGANATPSWTLVNFKGPGPASGSLLSAMRTKTNTLNIVLGSPSSEDAQSAVNALQVGTAVANSLAATTGH